MSNELIESLSGGELAPYDAGQPLAPHNHGDWANTDVDLLHERQHAPQTLTFFGQPLPGVSEQQVQATLNGMATLFIQDMAALRYPPNLIGFAAKFFRESALKPARQVRASHNFELPTELVNDWMANDFCNHLENVDGGTKRQKAQFLGAAITWLAKLAKHANSQTHVSHEPAQGSAPNSSEAMLNRLSEADYNKVVAINEKAKQQTMGTLAAKHGQYTAQQMLVLAQEYLNQLPIDDQNHFDQFTTVNGQSFVHMMNTVDAIEFLHGASIGAASLPTNGSDIAKEIAQFEAMLKVPAERAKYMRDPQMQARLRELYSRRG